MSCKNDRDDDPCVSSPLALCILCAYGCGGVETIDSMLAGRAVVEIWPCVSIVWRPSLAPDLGTLRLV